MPADPQTAPQKRLALVIGNSSYRNVSGLNNPVNDANDIAAALKRQGFSVTLKHDTDHRTLFNLVEAFNTKLKQTRAVGLFYYAGHGIQHQGANYLIPVDAKLTKPSDLRFEALDVERLLTNMPHHDKRLNIVILDACRDNPFKGDFRGISRGLAQMNAPSGTLLAYATAPGDTAADGTGRNGIYTKHLLEHLEKPDQTIEAMFKQVRRGVMAETENRQVPWESSSLLGDFYFVNKIPLDSLFYTTPKPPADPCAQANGDERPVSCLFKEKP